MLQLRNRLTGLLGPGGWLSIALLAVAVFLFFYATGSAQPAISVPALTAQSSSGAVDLSWTAVTGAERYELWVWDRRQRRAVYWRRQPHRHDLHARRRYRRHDLPLRHPHSERDGQRRRMVRVCLCDRTRAAGLRAGSDCAARRRRSGPELDRRNERATLRALGVGQRQPRAVYWRKQPHRHDLHARRRYRRHDLPLHHPHSERRRAVWSMVRVCLCHSAAGTTGPATHSHADSHEYIYTVADADDYAYAAGAFAAAALLAVTAERRAAHSHADCHEYIYTVGYTVGHGCPYIYVDVDIYTDSHTYAGGLLTAGFRDTQPRRRTRRLLHRQPRRQTRRPLHRPATATPPSVPSLAAAATESSVNLRGQR